MPRLEVRSAHDLVGPLSTQPLWWARCRRPVYRRWRARPRGPPPRSSSHRSGAPSRRTAAQAIGAIGDQPFASTPPASSTPAPSPDRGPHVRSGFTVPAVQLVAVSGAPLRAMSSSVLPAHLRGPQRVDGGCGSRDTVAVREAISHDVRDGAGKRGSRMRTAVRRSSAPAPPPTSSGFPPSNGSLCVEPRLPLHRPGAVLPCSQAANAH